MTAFLITVGLLLFVIIVILKAEANRKKSQYSNIATRPDERSDVAESISVKTPRKETPFSNEVMAQLKKLGELKERGVLTEEEFQRQKAKLLSHQT